MRARFSDLPVGVRILTGYAAVAGLMLIVAVYALGSLARVDEVQDDLIRTTDARKAARSLDVEILGIIVSLQYFVDTQDSSLITELGDRRRTADSLRAEIRRLTRSPVALAALDGYERLLPRRRELADSMMAAARRGVSPHAIGALQRERRELDDQARYFLSRIIEEQDALVTERQRVTQQATRRVRRNVTLVGGVAVIVALVFTAFMTRSITSPIHRLRAMSERIGTGDYGATSEVTSRDEIGSLARAFEDMARNVGRLDQAKDEFMGLASHQLRTPATAVKNFIGLLREGYAGDLTAEQKSYVDHAWDSNEQQLEIIDAMLRVARTDAGLVTLNRKMIDLERLATRVVDQQMPTMTARRQTCRIEVADGQSVRAYADVDYLHMAVENLVSNASKYTPEGGAVVVSLETGDFASISVRDNGVGIADEDLPRLFGKFSRIDNELSMQVGGTGIGLYLTRRIVDLHGGRIDVRSRPHEGTTFTITLPNQVD